MALEVVTVGAEVLYCIETTAGTRPTTGYKLIPNIDSAPEFPMDVDTIDVSDITDRIKRYVEGQQDPGADKSFTLNHTEAAISASETMVKDAEDALAAGKEVWFQYRYPAPADKSWYFSGRPKALGNNGITKNDKSTIPAHVVFTGGAVWAAKSTTDAT